MCHVWDTAPQAVTSGGSYQCTQFLIVTLPLISYVLNFYLYMNFLCTLLDSAFIYLNHCTNEVGRDLRMLPGPTAGLRGNTR